MSVIQKISETFSAYAQTSDRHNDKELETHYYKANVKQAMDAVVDIVSSQSGYKVTNVQEERGEIGITIEKPKRALLIVTVTMVRPYHTAVDFSVSTESKLSFGFGKKVIVGMYEKLDKTLSFTGKGSSE